MLNPKINHLLCLMIATAITLSPHTMSVTIAQQRTPIIISFGRPNIWSLEQAHYLLARLRSQTLGLQSRELAATDLDPNEVNGTRLQTLKTLLGIGVGFNQAAGFQNSQATKELQFSQDRRHQLLALRDQREAQLHDINMQLATSKVEREKMNVDSASTDAAKKVKDTEIEQATAQQTAVNNEITSLTAEINGLPAAATSLATPAPPSAEASPLPNDVVDQLLGTDGFKNEMNQSSKLNASTKLDNYLNLQYEIIAKQLTSLRDEVGPDQRLVFLELPQSFYTVPDKSNRKLAQVWWHIDQIYERPSKRDEELTRVDSDCPNYRADKDEYQKKEQAEIESSLENALPRTSDTFRRCDEHGLGRPRTEQEIFKDKKPDASTTTQSDQTSKTKSPDNEFYAVDLIPRQSALNVNDIQDKQKKFNLMGLFTWLSGLGVSIDYQREQRLYQQFLQQEVYASAFGKGARDFGWTFGPRPGMERISPGLQTTYAILAVPEKAEGLKLTARGCYFSRTDYAPNNFDEAKNNSESNNLRCSEERNFDLLIPSTTENNFWVTGLDYRPVKPGALATVYIRGDYFSPQIGVLVNGVALRHSIGLAQAELALSNRNNNFEPTPIGDFEFVNSKLLILSFSIPDFKGTPSISLVTPGRARIVNDLRIVINDSYKCSAAEYKIDSPNCVVQKDGKRTELPYKLMSRDHNVREENSIWVRLDKQPAMFSETSPAPVLSIDGLKLFENPSNSLTFKANLIGSKFSEEDEIRVNGSAIVCYDMNGKPTACEEGKKQTCAWNGAPVNCQKLLAPGLFEIEFPKTRAETLEIMVIHHDKKKEDSVYTTKSFANPLALRVAKVTILSYEPKAKPHPLLTVVLEGVGFSSRINVDARPSAYIDPRSQSDTAMILGLNLLNSDKFITLTLSDPESPGLKIPVIISRPEESTNTASQAENDKSSEVAKTRKPKSKKLGRAKI